MLAERVSQRVSRITFIFGNPTRMVLMFWLFFFFFFFAIFFEENFNCFLDTKNGYYAIAAIY
jgi:hypothetical protein